MNPFIAIGVLLIVLNLWLKRRIDRRIKQSKERPKWDEKMDREKYNEEITKLKIKYMTHTEEELEEMEALEEAEYDEYDEDDEWD